MQISPVKPSLEQRLLLEGWSLHQRLSWAIAHGCPSGGGGHQRNALQSWRQVVAVDNAENFDKRLAWDGLAPRADSKFSQELMPAAAAPLPVAP